MTPRSRKSLGPRRPAPSRRPRGMVQRLSPGPESCCCTEGRRRWQRARCPRPPPAPSCSPWPGLCWRRARPEVSRRAQAAPCRSPAVPSRPLGTRPPGAPRAALGGTPSGGIVPRPGARGRSCGAPGLGLPARRGPPPPTPGANSRGKEGALGSGPGSRRRVARVAQPRGRCRVSSHLGDHLPGYLS